ncbi:hypothetical protein [Roseospira navarrensis]|uniref:Uncharacterized protein n=1 Tax=Roseospira navarrensis TaxID=140058 RepID=A0A7X1ZD97_9PROT|nr:hypothetical protein [Roseospira navarrensis]MQX36431.1 hypothetical protein [Roseospira navarrensis]
MRRRATAAVFLLLAAFAAALLVRAVTVPDPGRRAEAAFAEAIAHGRTDRLHDAAEAWRDTLAASPTDAFAWTGLAWAEALRGAPDPYVARLMERGRRLAPHVPALAEARARWGAWRDRRPPAAPGP